MAVSRSLRLALLFVLAPCGALLISAPYPLTGTTSEAMLRAERAAGRWRGGLLTGVETTLRLEKHRKKRPGEIARLIFRAPECP